MATRLTSLFQLSIWMLAGQVSCGSIAGFWNGVAPSFLMQDDETGGILYSLCNGNHTPIFPNDPTLTVPFVSYQPKNQTSLTAAGWIDSGSAVASIFYLDNNDEIVNALLKCDTNTGHWGNTGEYVISGGSPKVAPNTGLSAVLLGATDGYRVYYNGLDGTLHQIGYTSSTTWKYYGVVSNDKMSAQAIGSTFSNGNITVIRSRDSKNMGVSRLYSDHSWHLSSFPESLTLTGNKSTNATEASDLQLNTTSAAFTLPAWDGNASALAVGIDKQYTRSVFYIGTDKQVYQMSNINYAWEAVDRPAGNAWPNADVGGDNIGIVNDFNNNIMRLYYTSGGRMVEANGDNGNWQAATVLATSNSSQVADNPAANSTSTPAADGGQSGLSDGAKAGISVGVTVGVIAVGGMLFAFWFLRRRQRKLDAAAAAAAAGGSGASNGGDQQYMSPSSGYTVPTNHTVDGYPPQMAQVQGAYTPLQQGGYAQQQQPGYAYGHAVSADGAYAQPVPQHGYPAQDGGGWAYGTPSEGGQQGYFYPQQQQHQHQQQQQQYPQELADQPRPVELIGEGHYKEIP
ncbi:hypothetical protein F4821DRAFT_51614 [Hypoxylon rubiginosum]|uniref:Uncharacterized protein n=1 Tax=Hypoxylon rubiginosum TaxID=110542 RepID=A0ACC0DAW3_9PEZI|nr:hypothetical protein F4821DRAFT_51614 [Hypoxylon rubiginosum]